MDIYSHGQFDSENLFHYAISNKSSIFLLPNTMKIWL